MVNLKAKYREFNRKYFKNKLPSIPVFYGKLPHRAMGVTRYWHFKPICIVVSNHYKLLPYNSTALMTLLHEMVHVSLPYNVNHGRKFQLEMLRLAAEGAFDRLW